MKLYVPAGFSQQALKNNYALPVKPRRLKEPEISVTHTANLNALNIEMNTYDNGCIKRRGFAAGYFIIYRFTGKNHRRDSVLFSTLR